MAVPYPGASKLTRRTQRYSGNQTVTVKIKFTDALRWGVPGPNDQFFGTLGSPSGAHATPKLPSALLAVLFSRTYNAALFL